MDWRTSSYSGANGGNRVETASASGVILVRDTTSRDSATLAFTAQAWQTFTVSVAASRQRSGG